ncbi:uncharacterized protein LY89DRAFT_569843, partial [Mollisia scopiformis]
SRRTTVARACVLCQRRKVKCNGLHPCYNCCASKQECIYSERRRRTNTTDRRRSGTGTLLQDYQIVFNRLLGQVPVKSLVDLPRESLVDLIVSDGTSVQRLSSVSPHGLPRPDPSPVSSSAETEAAHRLEALEERPPDGFEWDESSDQLWEIVVDDVNGLGLAPNKKASFLGLASISVAVKVLLKALPSPVVQDLTSTNGKNRDHGWFDSSPAAGQFAKSQDVSYREGQRLIDAYFTHVHVFVPMIQEQSFRATYLANERKDSPWLALLHMVFAMGSIASSTSDCDQDIYYYQRARQHLGLESLGSGHMETLQALTLMGGLYLHYRNRPNLASALLGAALRIACSLGLHREFPSPSDTSRGIDREINRRTWWSIHILDSWGSTTLGRPQTSDENRVEIPKNMMDDRFGDAPPTQPTICSPLIHSIEFCKILSRIQRRLQMCSFLAFKEISILDQMLVSWFESLPSFMKPPNPCPPELHDVRTVLSWRYLNMRIILHRAVILDTTERHLSFFNLGVEEQEAVKKCRDLAAESIYSISTEWRPTKMSGWNAVWFLFQAVLIPLMALAVESEEHEDYHKWQEQVVLVIQLCGEMDRWSLVGRKTQHAVQRLYNASK